MKLISNKSSFEPGGLDNQDVLFQTVKKFFHSLDVFFQTVQNSSTVMMSFFKLSRLRQCHTCAQVENPGEGVCDVFAKIPRGSRLSGKIAGRVHLFGFYCIFINKFFKTFPGGQCYFITPSPLPVCIYGVEMLVFEVSIISWLSRCRFLNCRNQESLLGAHQDKSRPPPPPLRLGYTPVMNMTKTKKLRLGILISPAVDAIFLVWFQSTPFWD